MTAIASQPIISHLAWNGLRSRSFRWAVLPAAIAWLFIFTLPLTYSAAICIAPRQTWSEHVSASIALTFQLLDLSSISTHWLIMTVAMMLPLQLPMMRHVASQVFTHERERVVGLFVCSYVATWLGLGVIVSAAASAIRVASPSFFIPIGVFGYLLLAWWHASLLRRRAIYRSHLRVALRSSGPGASWDSFAFGATHALRCSRVCLPAMALPLLAGHSSGAMAIVFAVLLAERLTDNTDSRAASVIFAMMALGAVVS